MNYLDIKCIKSEIKEINNQIINKHKELAKLQYQKKKLEIKLIAMDTRTEDERLRDEYPINYCFNTIKNEECLWDLRFWKSNHDRIEVVDWIGWLIDLNIHYDKNIGHTTFCIYILIIIYGIDKEKVIDAIMENDFISYRDKMGELV